MKGWIYSYFSKLGLKEWMNLVLGVNDGDLHFKCVNLWLRRDFNMIVKVLSLGCQYWQYFCRTKSDVSEHFRYQSSQTNMRYWMNRCFWFLTIVTVNQPFCILINTYHESKLTFFSQVEYFKTLSYWTKYPSPHVSCQQCVCTRCKIPNIFY